MREVRFSVYIDTNKQTIDETFASWMALVDYCRRLQDAGLLDLSEDDDD